jgi:hypothetical protein
LVKECYRKQALRTKKYVFTEIVRQIKGKGKVGLNRSYANTKYTYFTINGIQFAGRVNATGEAIMKRSFLEISVKELSEQCLHFKIDISPEIQKWLSDWVNNYQHADYKHVWDFSIGKIRAPKPSEKAESQFLHGIIPDQPSQQTMSDNRSIYTEPSVQETVLDPKEWWSIGELKTKLPAFSQEYYQRATIYGKNPYDRFRINEDLDIVQYIASTKQMKIIGTVQDLQIKPRSTQSMWEGRGIQLDVNTIQAQNTQSLMSTYTSTTTPYKLPASYQRRYPTLTPQQTQQISNSMSQRISMLGNGNGNGAQTVGGGAQPAPATTSAHTSFQYGMGTPAPAGGGGGPPDDSGTPRGTGGGGFGGGYGGGGFGTRRWSSRWWSR